MLRVRTDRRGSPPGAVAARHTSRVRVHAHSLSSGPGAERSASAGNSCDRRSIGIATARSIRRPAALPNPPLHFYSDCWSNHAQGRASDFKVGDGSPARVRIARGTALVEWLLAPDALGNKQARARRLGCKRSCSSTDAGTPKNPTTSTRRCTAELDECDIGHYDHVHLSFTVDGALGLTSGYGPRAPAARLRGLPTRHPPSSNAASNDAALPIGATDCTQ